MPGARDMDIFEQQEMHKNKQQVTSKLNDWYDWLVNHVPNHVKDKVSRAFKTFKDKVVGLYNGVKGDTVVRFRPDRPRQPEPFQLKPKRGKETFIEPPVKQIKASPPSKQKQIKRMKKKLNELNRKIRHSNQKHNNLISKRNSVKKKIEKLKGSHEPEPGRPREPIELEQAFGRAYRSYRINGRGRMDVDTFFDWIRRNLIHLMNREVTELGSARVQTTAWIRFIQASKDDFFENIIGFDRVRLPFNSRMLEIFQDSDLNKLVDGIIAHMRMQIENPALANSRFRFDEVLFLDI